MTDRIPSALRLSRDPAQDSEHDRLARRLLEIHSVAREHTPLILCHAQAAVLLKDGWGQRDLEPLRIEAMADVLREWGEDRRDGWEYILSALLLNVLEFPL